MVGPFVGVLVILAALAVFVVVGVRGTRTQDVEDFLVARGTQGRLSLGLSFFAAGVGAWVLFAPPEVGAIVGIAAVLGYAVGAGGPFVAFALLGPRLRRVVPAGHSLVEYVRLRFGPVVHGYIVGLSVLYMVVFLMAELTAAGGIGALVAGVDPAVTILAVALGTLAYTAYGGLRASIRTDRLQAWIIVALLALAAVAIVVEVDDPAALDPRALTAVGRVGVEAALTLIIAVTAANLFHQGYWQRVWAARDDAALRAGAGIAVAGTVPVLVVLGLLGMYAAGTGRDLGTPPLPLFVLLTGLPAWIGVVVLGLGIALVASSVDTLENALASLVVTERRHGSVASARWATALLLIPAVLVALQGFSVLRLFLVADLLCAGAVVPALLSVWRRGTAAGALSGALAGLVGAVLPGWIATGQLSQGVLRATFPGAVPTLPPFAGALVLSTVVAVVVSLAQGRVVDLEAVGAQATPLPTR